MTRRGVLPPSFGLPPVDLATVHVNAVSYVASDSVANYRAFRNRSQPFLAQPDGLDLLSGRGAAEMSEWVSAPSTNP